MSKVYIKYFVVAFLLLQTVTAMADEEVGNGCKVRRRNPLPHGVSYQWTGNCSNGYAEEIGTLIQTTDGIPRDLKGSMKGGYRIGTWTEGWAFNGQTIVVTAEYGDAGVQQRLDFVSAPAEIRDEAQRFVLSMRPASQKNGTPGTSNNQTSRPQAPTTSGYGFGNSEYCACAGMPGCGCKGGDPTPAPTPGSTNSGGPCARPPASDIAGNRAWCQCVAGNFTSSGNYWTCRSNNGTVLSACSSRGNGWQCQSQ